jgi:hypothetical protein
MKWGGMRVHEYETDDEEEDGHKEGYRDGGATRRGKGSGKRDRLDGIGGEEGNRRAEEGVLSSIVWCSLS